MTERDRQKISSVFFNWSLKNSVEFDQSFFRPIQILKINSIAKYKVTIYSVILVALLIRSVLKD